MARRRYSVYVIELDPAVRNVRRFREANPTMRPGARCAYVGSTYRTPDERFDQHKQGYKSNRFVRQHGLRLLPEVFAPYNPIPTRADAEELEEYLAERLRARGWGIWQG